MPELRLYLTFVISSPPTCMLARTATATRPNRLAAFHESARSLRALKWIVLPLVIAALNRQFRNTFAIVDGVVGMEGNGPIQGTRKHAGVLVMGRDLRPGQRPRYRIAQLRKPPSDPFAPQLLIERLVRGR